MPVVLDFHPVFFEFISRNSAQILAKSKFFKLEKEEVENSLYVLIASQLSHYDPAQGSEEAFFFGLLHAHLARYTYDPCHQAASLDDDSAHGRALKERVEFKCAIQNRERCFTHTNPGGIAPGAATLASLADAVSGQSTQEIARHLRITKRRVNQIRQRQELAARNQFGFDFSEGGDYV